MADWNDVGYRMLSFKYTPVKAQKEEKPAEAEGRTSEGPGAAPRAGPAELPSLSSLMTSLKEIEGSNDDGSNQAATSESVVAVEKTDEETQASTAESTEAAESPPDSSAPATTPLTEFHLFGDLPTELRLKIWKLTYLPRVVDLRPTRPNYSTSYDDGRQPQWQSGCSNPAALSVSAEAREFALEHFRAAFPLACITSAQQEHRGSFARYATDTVYNFRGPSASGRARLLRRTLYVSPDEDTVCLLGQDSDFTRLSHVMRSFREADPKGLGISRLGLSVRGWGYGGSAVMMKGLGRTVLRDLDQLVLFMYSEHSPPAEWRDRSVVTSGDQLEEFRRKGNRCELIRCEGSNAWYAYKVWSGGKGRQFWDDDGNILKVGRNEIRIMDLEFKEGW